METIRERKDRLESEKIEEKRVKALKVAVKRRVRSDITHSGILSVQYKMEHIEKNPGSEMKTELSRETIIGCYKEVIEQYYNSKKDGK
jgi:hypothetical protein